MTAPQERDPRCQYETEQEGESQGNEDITAEIDGRDDDTELLSEVLTRRSACLPPVRHPC
jgi:hypothetical protein